MERNEIHFGFFDAVTAASARISSLEGGIVACKWNSKESCVATD